MAPGPTDTTSDQRYRPLIRAARELENIHLLPRRLPMCLRLAPKTAVFDPREPRGPIEHPAGVGGRRRAAPSSLRPSALLPDRKRSSPHRRVAALGSPGGALRLGDDRARGGHLATPLSEECARHLRQPRPPAHRTGVVLRLAERVVHFANGRGVRTALAATRGPRGYVLAVASCRDATRRTDATEQSTNAETVDILDRRFEATRRAGSIRTRHELERDLRQRSGPWAKVPTVVAGGFPCCRTHDA